MKISLNNFFLHSFLNFLKLDYIHIFNLYNKTSCEILDTNILDRKIITKKIVRNESK